MADDYYDYYAGCPYSNKTCYLIAGYEYYARRDPTCYFGYVCDDENAISKCGYNVTIKECSSCRATIVTVLGVFFGIIAFAGLFINALVIATVFIVKRKSRTSFDYMKLSLAVADCLWGVQIFGFTIPNIANTLQSAPKELIAYAATSLNTPITILDYLMGDAVQVASLYHVAVFSVQRFLAIMFPNWFSKWGKVFTFSSLGFVWTLTLAIFFIEVYWVAPGLKKNFLYTIYLFSATRGSNNFTTYLWFVVYYIVPFTTMTIMTIATGIIIKIKLGNVSSRSIESIRRQRSIFITLILMEVILFFAIAPLASLNFILKGNSGCYEPTLATVICVLLAAINSVMDPIVYTIKDEAFKKNCRLLYSKLLGKPIFDRISSTNSTRVTNL